VGDIGSLNVWDGTSPFPHCVMLCLYLVFLFADLSMCYSLQEWAWTMNTRWIAWDLWCWKLNTVGLRNELRHQQGFSGWKKLDFRFRERELSVFKFQRDRSICKHIRASMTEQAPVWSAIVVPYRKRLHRTEILQVEKTTCMLYHLLFCACATLSWEIYRNLTC